jgi:hypothetical protein
MAAITTQVQEIHSVLEVKLPTLSLAVGITMEGKTLTGFLTG